MVLVKMVGDGAWALDLGTSPHEFARVRVMKGLRGFGSDRSDEAEASRAPLGAVRGWCNNCWFRSLPVGIFFQYGKCESIEWIVFVRQTSLMVCWEVAGGSPQKHLNRTYLDGYRTICQRHGAPSSRSRID